MYEDIIDSMLPKITAAGMSAPEFQTILTGWQTIFRGIYGDDIYIDPDSKDGVLLSLIAYAMHGGNNAAIATGMRLARRPAPARGWRVTSKSTASAARSRQIPRLT